MRTALNLIMLHHVVLQNYKILDNGAFALANAKYVLWSGIYPSVTTKCHIQVFLLPMYCQASTLYIIVPHYI